MPGTNGGTGRPLSFRCTMCRRADDYRHKSRKGWRDRVKLTGRKRRCPPGDYGNRNSEFRREYLCDDCGHVGWSRHTDLEALERAE